MSDFADVPFREFKKEKKMWKRLLHFLLRCLCFSPSYLLSFNPTSYDFYLSTGTANEIRENFSVLAK